MKEISQINFQGFISITTDSVQRLTGKNEKYFWNICRVASEWTNEREKLRPGRQERDFF